MFGDGMRVPVTSMRSPRSAVCAKAKGAAMRARASSVAMTHDFLANAFAGRFVLSMYAS
jgi:hypothetical protein